MDNHSLQKAAWIWPSSDFTRNQRANFFFEAELDTLPATAEVCVVLACGLCLADGVGIVHKRENILHLR